MILDLWEDEEDEEQMLPDLWEEEPELKQSFVKWEEYSIHHPPQGKSRIGLEKEEIAR